MRLQELFGPAEEAQAVDPWKPHVAALMQRLKAWLRKVALSLANRRQLSGVPELEFYAEAGAPEGAPFADGLRVGTPPDVTRL